MSIPFRPIITICGTTGVGKSKLAIELALHHMNQTSRNNRWKRAKIINADSMQVYKGLDVITNKVPEAERQGVPHLLMDLKKPGEQYVVGEWVKDTLRLIDEMHANDELPIIVGGTAYWIQHLIFPNRLISKDSSTPSESATPPEWSASLLSSIASLPPELLSLLENLPAEAPSAKTDPDGAFRLHTLLSILDPVMSQRWHWKDTRKVLRNLEIIKESKTRPSEILHQQSSEASNAKPRFHTLCFWLYSDPEVLGERLDRRVDDMISQGLVDEVKSLRQIAADTPYSDDSTTSNMDFTLGIYQSIGYREFCAYLDAPSDASYKEALYRMKVSTRQYARRQIMWIRNKLIPATIVANAEETLVPFYLLDATELGDSWFKNVLSPAIQIEEAFLERKEMLDPKTLSEHAAKMLTVEAKDIRPTAVLLASKRRICHVCTMQEDRPVMLEEGSEWDIHQKTRSHRRLAAKLVQKDYSQYQKQGRKPKLCTSHGEGAEAHLVT
ncbi:tRNA isopentenyltransferase [Agrocybe pediades]|nr:tRNA isopentenyltransferase [Agrocybe pediades]